MALHHQTTSPVVVTTSTKWNVPYLHNVNVPQSARMWSATTCLQRHGAKLTASGRSTGNFHRLFSGYFLCAISLIAEKFWILAILLQI